MAVEQACREGSLKTAWKVITSHNKHLINLQRQAEALDNQGHRCCNIIVRGLPESVEPEAILVTLQTILKDIQDRPPDSPLELEGALWSRGRHTNLPRDVICCFVSFQLNEEVM